MFHRITRRGLIAYAHDIFMAALSFWLSLYLRLGDTFYLYLEDGLLLAGVTLTLISANVFWFSGLYRGVWRYASIADLWAITRAVTLIILLFAFVMFIWTRLEMLPRSILIINWFVMMALLGSPRFLYRLIKDKRFDLASNPIGHNQIPVLLVGAGDQAELFIRALRQSGETTYKILGIIAEDAERVGREIHGVSIIGMYTDIPKLVKSFDVNQRPHRLILTNEKLEGNVLRSLLDDATSLGMTLARIPRVTEFKTKLSDSIEIKPVAIEDLLGRVQKPLDRESMRKLVEGRRVLVTGGGGSIGSELVRQISDFDPSAIMILDQSELALYKIDLEILGSHPQLNRESAIGDIRDSNRINKIFTNFRPELVFHAAALKHVPLVESNIFEGITTNVLGTANIANACASTCVETMVLISTDKAINPSSIMGASKRLAEIYCQALDIDNVIAGATRYVTVRFGNVLGSAGSVVPLFQEQLSMGGPLTVTHKKMTRYFMTIAEAVELVLQASALGNIDRTGKIYVLDMGDPVRIFDLATQMIKLAGLTPGKDIEIKIIGPRAGEKMFEELLHGSESLISTQSEGILLAAPRMVDLKEIKKGIAALGEACINEDETKIMSIIKKFIPEFSGRTAAISRHTGS